MSTYEHFVGTRAVSDQHAFDTNAMTDWMSRHVQGFEGPLQVEMFKGGQSNPTYKLITPGQSYVMRAKPGPVAKLLPSAHAIEREYRVMKGLAGTDVPVPHMYALCEDESVIGRAFYIMEFMEGRVLWDQSLPGMTPAERGQIYDEMNRVIAALHSGRRKLLCGLGAAGGYALFLLLGNLLFFGVHYGEALPVLLPLADAGLLGALLGAGRRKKRRYA